MKVHAVQSLSSALSFKSILRNRPIILALLLAIGLALLLTVQTVTSPTIEERQAAYKETLQRQVQDERGAPSNGRDPSTQQQSDLAAVASLPSGAGQRTDTPASAISSDHDGHTHQDVPGTTNNATQSGSFSSGCIIGYGIAGSQCLPVAVIKNGSVACADVTRYFSKGVSVTGKDTYGLDKNKDGIACDSADLV